MPNQTEQDKDREIQRLLKLLSELNEENERLAEVNESSRNNASSEAMSRGRDLGAILDAEKQAERWIRLDYHTLMRASDIRQITAGSRGIKDQQLIGNKWFHWFWPHPSLTINSSVELPFPLWTLAELLVEIGAEEVPMPRGEEEIKLLPEKGMPLPAEKPSAEPV